jgi:pimeloyl-ACP methyl ester carboxylesterase
LPDPDTDVLPTHGIEIAVIPNADHGTMWDNPAAFVQVVARFVARLASSETDAKASAGLCACA